MKWNYKDLLVWKKSIDLVKEIYNLTWSFPKTEIYWLADQIKRCSISIPSNIAEWANRNTKKEFVNFLYISRGSLAELETQLIIAKSLKFLNEDSLKKIDSQIQEIWKMLNWPINSIKKTDSLNY